MTDHLFISEQLHLHGRKEIQKGEKNIDKPKNRSLFASISKVKDDKNEGKGKQCKEINPSGRSTPAPSKEKTSSKLSFGNATEPAKKKRNMHSQSNKKMSSMSFKIPIELSSMSNFD